MLSIFHLVAWYYPGPPGGSEAYVAGISRTMMMAGCRVRVVVPQCGISGIETYQHDGVSVVRYPIPSVVTREEVQGKTVVRGTEHLHDLIRRERPDVVHFHTFSTGLGIPEMRVARETGARVFVTSHLGGLGYLCKRGTMMRWGESQCDGIAKPVKCAACVLYDHVPRAVAWLMARLMMPAATMPGKLKTLFGFRQLIRENLQRQREVLQLCDAFFVPTQWAADTMLANGAPDDRIFVIRVGLAHDQIARKPGPKERPTQRPVRIGYFGRFDRVKGISDLARAFVALPKDLSLRLEFCGPVVPGESSAVLAETKAIIGNDSRVSFQPGVPPTEAFAVLADCDVLCCPSVWFESGPMVALEAFACGTPVIGTRIGGLAEIVKPGASGDLVEPGDWRALSRLLRRIAENPAETVDCWRTNLPKPRTMAEVADDYLSIYKAFVLRSLPRLADQIHDSTSSQNSKDILCCDPSAELD
jgi:glycosyltransferase involved in cell wall biosynthesis